MKRRALILGLLVAAIVAFESGVADSVTPARVTPAAGVSPSAVSPGATVFVTGGSWPPHTEVSVAVCGEEARHGSADCDLASSTIVGTGADGVFGTQLAVQIPPKPCPCVVQISSVDSSDELAIPLVIAGAPSVPLPPRSIARGPRPLTIQDAHVGRGSWTTWFGWGTPRTLVLTLKNTSGGPLNKPLVLVAAGRASKANEPQRIPVQGPFATGEIRTLRVPVEFDTPSIGDYAVRIRAGSDGTTVTKMIGTSSYPWALFVIALLLVQCLLVLGRNRVHGRIAPDPDEHTIGEMEQSISPVVAARTVGAHHEPPGTNGGSADHVPVIRWRPDELIRWKAPETPGSG